MDQLPLEKFEKVELEFLFVKILLFVSLVKSWLLVGRSVDYGKKGEFLKSIDQFLLEYLTSCLNKCV
jgi:hypothetical protein